MHDDPWEHGHFGDDEEAIFGSIAEDGFPINPDWLRLTSVGIDIGTSTSHLMFSKLVMRRRSTEMSSEFEVVSREVRYRSPILLTPYSDPDTIDTDALGDFVKNSYVEAELEHDDIDTGAVICTGEAVRKHNSEAIVRMLATAGGRFVCATAGPNLEAILGAPRLRRRCPIAEDRHGDERRYGRRNHEGRHRSEWQSPGNDGH